MLRAKDTTRQCLLKYNYKGGQSESVISPIELKQLFVPFMILICGLLLAFIQFLRELMHAHFEKQKNSAPVSTVKSIEVPTETNVSNQSKTNTVIESNFKSNQDIPLSTTVTTLAIVIDASLTVVDISNDPNE